MVALLARFSRTRLKPPRRRAVPEGVLLCASINHLFYVTQKKELFEIAFERLLFELEE